MLPVQTAAFDLVAVDEEIEPVGILRRDEVHFPKREKQRERDRCGGGKEQQARPQIERAREEAKLASKQLCDSIGHWDSLVTLRSRNRTSSAVACSLRRRRCRSGSVVVRRRSDRI